MYFIRVYYKYRVEERAEWSRNGAGSIMSLEEAKGVGVGEASFELGHFQKLIKELK